MRIPLWPRLRLGRLAVIMAAAALFLILIRAIVIRATGFEGGGYFFSNPPVEILNIVIWLSASGAFVAGVGDLSYRDWSLSVPAGSILGFIVFLNGVIRMMAPP